MTKTIPVFLNQSKDFFRKPQNLILLIFGVVLSVTTIAPVVTILLDTVAVHPGTIDAMHGPNGFTVEKFLESAYKHAVACDIQLYRSYLNRRSFCIFDYTHKYKMQKISECCFYFSVYNASVDIGSYLDKLI